MARILGLVFKNDVFTKVGSGHKMGTVQTASSTGVSAFFQHSLIISAAFSFNISHLLQFISILTIFSYNSATSVTESTTQPPLVTFPSHPLST